MRASAVLHPDESHRPGVVRRRRGERFGHRGLDEFGRNGFGTELTDRPAQQLGLAAAQPKRFVGAQPEQVFLARPQQRARVGSVVAQCQSTHHRDGDAGQFALHQIGRRGDLVGDRHLGDDELVAVPIVRSGVAVQHRQPGGTDREIGLAVAPCPPHGVGDHHADRHPEPLMQHRAQCRGAGVRVHRKQRQLRRADIGAVHTGRRLHQPKRVLGDQRAALARQHAYGFDIDQFAPQRIPFIRIRGRRDDSSLALGHHLAGDHHDVVVAQPRRGRGDRSAQVVSGPELRQPGHRKHFDGSRGAMVVHRRGPRLKPARSSPARTISAVVGGSVISSGTARTSTPSISARSSSCTSQPSRMPTPERGP